MKEIDGIRRQLESSRTQAGDYLSDDYWQMLDFITSGPALKSHNERKYFEYAINRLNINLGTIIAHLGNTSVSGEGYVEAYNSVVEQVNDIASNAGFDGSTRLRPIDSESLTLPSTPYAFY